MDQALGVWNPMFWIPRAHLKRDTQHLFTASVSLWWEQSQRQENLWRPLPAQHEQRQRQNSRVPISYMVEDKDLHMCTLTHTCLCTHRGMQHTEVGERREEERGREIYHPHIKSSQSSICFKNSFISGIWKTTWKTTLYINMVYL